MGDDRSDGELLGAIGAGDQAALRVLYLRHAPWLLSRLRHRCADEGLVAEAVQDTFTAVWRSSASWTGSGDAGAWIWGIGIRRLVGGLRKAGRVPVPMAEREDSLLVSAEDAVLLGVEHGDLAGALGRLSPELRAVVQATVLDGLTTREAGHLLGIPAGTVKTRMMRARAELRGALA